MTSRADTHTHTRIPTRGPKQFQETRCVRPSAARAWFKNHYSEITWVRNAKTGIKLSTCLILHVEYAFLFSLCFVAN